MKQVDTYQRQSSRESRNSRKEITRQENTLQSKTTLLQDQVQHIVKREIQPIVKTIIKPIIQKEIQPIVQREIQPIVQKEIIYSSK